MTATQPSPLVTSVASGIINYIEEAGHLEGSRLVERKLGEQLKVSRSPIRHALQLLEDQGVVRRADKGGYEVATVPENNPNPSPATGDERYHQMATDRLEGRLADRVTENFLMRRYGFTRTELAETLRRMSKEGWIDRAPGYGWQFLPTLDSMTMYQDSYRFRMVIEPAAMLESSFVLDVEALTRCRQEQQRLIDGDIWSVSNAALFDANSALHEAVMACSHNTFFYESLQRVDRLRRLIEYQKALPRERAVQRCREHVQLIDLLLAGHNEAASAFMREHLRSVSVEKIQPGPGTSLTGTG